VCYGIRVNPQFISTGVDGLDTVLQGFQLGDNVVWQVDHLGSYLFFAEPFMNQALEEGRTGLYIRFGEHDPILPDRPDLKIIEINPRPGFDVFTGEVHQVIEKHGREVFYVFDSLSSLASMWATDELLANFFQVTCPFLYELDTVAFFALERGKHANQTVARVRDTTQVLIDVLHARDHMIVHPLKVRDRYAPQLFMPHVVQGRNCTPLVSAEEHVRHDFTRHMEGEEPAISSIAPWESVFRQLEDYRQGERPDVSMLPEVRDLQRELTRMLMGNDPEVNALAERFLSLDDLFQIRKRVIGSGRIGGKATGMVLARAILAKSRNQPDLMVGVEQEDSFFIGSDVYYSYLVNNRLFRARLLMTRQKHPSREEYEEVEKRFLAGTFPEEIMESFEKLLAHFGHQPIIVRSSSLLEDSFGNAFAGKYRSEFCANQGSPEERLEAFAQAVKLVYASTLNPDALSYRQRRGLAESDEQMAVLVQRVSGDTHGRYHYPLLAGVAFSRNLYVWTDRINPERGVVRLVFGLGTRAVNRTERDYPRMVSISHPELRPEIGEEIIRYSQRDLDLLDLETNTFETRNLNEVVREVPPPYLHHLISFHEDQHVSDPITRRLDLGGKNLIMTFNNLIRRTDFVRVMGNILEDLEWAYGHPVDTEFAAEFCGSNALSINVLQCRPLTLPGGIELVHWPEHVPDDRVLFRSNRFISGGVIPAVRFLVYIDPRRYAALGDMDVKRSLARVIGRLNKNSELIDGKVIMMGPGRWGSTNLDLGIPVGYADIDHVSVLVEIAREEAGHVPEVSYGTHFFQDLVEADIIYLPVFPDDASSGFNDRFFEEAPNALSRYLSESGPFEDVIRLIDVPESTGGARACLVADPEQRRAMCYLDV